MDGATAGWEKRAESRGGHRKGKEGQKQKGWMVTGLCPVHLQAPTAPRDPVGVGGEAFFHRSRAGRDLADCLHMQGFFWFWFFTLRGATIFLPNLGLPFQATHHITWLTSPTIPNSPPVRLWWEGGSPPFPSLRSSSYLCSPCPLAWSPDPAWAGRKGVAVRVEDFALWRSTLLKAGAVHDELARYPLT